MWISPESGCGADEPTEISLGPQPGQGWWCTRSALSITVMAQLSMGGMYSWPGWP